MPMLRTIFAILTLAIVGLALGASSAGQQGDTPAGPNGDAPAAAPATEPTPAHADTDRHAEPLASPRFEYVDVYVDPHASPLAAYQFELKVVGGDALIVGVEGGEPAAFRAAPWYDPAALQSGRIIVGAFSTGADLPHARSRVARLHMMVRSPAPARYEIHLDTAGAPDGSHLDDAAVSFAQGDKE